MGERAHYSDGGLEGNGGCDRTLAVVMAGLDPAIHVFAPVEKTWMPGTSPGGRRA